MGANPDILQSGQCGHRCDGIKSVDNVGIFEYDTANDTIVGTHTLEDGSGADPYVSPDGEYVFMFGHNGGTSIRVLKAGESGMKSTVHADLVLGFNTSGVMADYVWVGGSEYEEIYVVDIVKKMVVKTITGIDAEQMVSVNNVEREQQAMMIQNM